MVLYASNFSLHWPAAAAAVAVEKAVDLFSDHIHSAALSPDSSDLIAGMDSADAAVDVAEEAVGPCSSLGSGDQVVVGVPRNSCAQEEDSVCTAGPNSEPVPEPDWGGKRKRR